MHKSEMDFTTTTTTMNIMDFGGIHQSRCRTRIPSFFFRARTSVQYVPRWNDDPLKCNIFPDLPIPFSPVHRHRKFLKYAKDTGI